MVLSTKFYSQEKVTQSPFVLVIHGGAGTILNSEMTADQEAAYSHL